MHPTLAVSIMVQQYPEGHPPFCLQSILPLDLGFCKHVLALHCRDWLNKNLPASCQDCRADLSADTQNSERRGEYFPRP